MTLLDDIVAHKREEVAARREQTPVDLLRSRALARPPSPSFSEALGDVPMGLLAEVKRRSPSAGVLRRPFDPAALAAAYEGAGAHAVSVLMDERYFGGGAEDFRAVRQAVSLPLLYKEFVVDSWQVWEAAALGASLVLLIAAVLDDAALAALLADVTAAGLTALVEVHDEEQMLRAATAGASCIGINNRDLRTFRVSIGTTLRLAEHAPEGALLVSESGIRRADDVLRLRRAGIRAVLVGERFLRQPDVAAAVKALMGPVWGCS
jgi:indole-3-glycerol phosphate synthase